MEVSAAKECCRDRERRRRELLAERNALREELQTARRELAEKDSQVSEVGASVQVLPLTLTPLSQKESSHTKNRLIE